jgi:hypothetical protein
MGFVDGCRATREFSRVAVPWQGGYTGSYTGSQTFGTVFGPVMRELAWKNVSTWVRSDCLFVLGLLVGI